MSAGPRGARRSAAWVALLAFAWLAATAGVRPLLLPDEGRYVGVAWEMLRSGNWLTPTLDGLPFFHKPPLFYWITGASLRWLGVHDWSARLASLLGATAAATGLYLFLRRWQDQARARAALVALAAQPIFYFGAQFANLDMLVAGCIGVTIVLLGHAALAMERQQPFRLALVLAYATAALGVLAKGLIGGVLPVLVVVPWLLLRGRWRLLGRMLSPVGAAVFLLIAAPWFVAMHQRYPDFLDYFFVVQHFRRFTAGGFNNVQPFWFYPALVGLASLPLLPWLRPLLRRTAWSEPGHGAVRLLMLLWAAGVMLFFSLPQSKLVGYVLPALPPLAALLADGYVQARQRWPRARLFWRGGVTVGLVAGLVSVGVVARQLQHTTQELATDLAARRTASEPVLMLEGYAYDVPLYARLAEPVRVVDRWDDPAVQRHDNWRKELADAGRFAPETAKALLIAPADLPVALCAAPVSWVIATTQAAARYPMLASLTPASTRHGQGLWRLDRADAAVATVLACGERPTAGSAGK